MNLFTAMEIAASGLSAQRTRLNAVASNLANARTTQTPEGGPYKRMDTVFRAVPVESQFADMLKGEENNRALMVTVPEVRQDRSPPQVVYEPGHPDANEDGFVEMPNVSVVEEMVNMITASRSYEAGVTVMKSISGMARNALKIGA